MEDEVGLVAPGGTDDGTGAVLYGMFTSFTEVLGALESQLAAIEDAVRAGPKALDERLPALEAAVRAGPAHLDARLGAIEAAVRAVPVLEERLAAIERALRAGAPESRPHDEEQAVEFAGLTDGMRRQSDLHDQRSAALVAAVDALRDLLQAHVDETTHSLGRRAGEAGRRLANDLGLRGRPKPPSLG